MLSITNITGSPRVSLKEVALTISGLIGGCFGLAAQVLTLVQFGVPKPVTVFDADVISDLEFGKYAVLGGVGSVEISPSGQRRIFGNLVDLGGSHGPAELKLQGRANEAFVVISSNFAVMHAPQGGRAINAYKLNTIPQRFGKFDAAGSAWIKVGGRMIVHRWHRDRGTYNGLASITLAYVK